MNALASQLTQVLLNASDVQVGVEKVIVIPQGTNILWFPAKYVVNGNLLSNPPGNVLGIRINSPSAPVLPWGVDGDSVMVYIGQVNVIFVQLLAGDSQPYGLLCAAEAGIGYSHATPIAGGVAAAPSFGANFGR